MGDKRIGILGGMGPEATILLQQRVLKALPVQDDADHIRLMIDMNPQVPSRLSWLLEGKGDNPGPILASMAQNLEHAGAQVLAMPCNTAHHFAQEINAAAGIELLNMPNLAAKALSETLSAGGRVGILASPATQTINLFQNALAPYGLEAVYPDQQDDILKAIQTIKINGVQDHERRVLQEKINTFEAQNIDAILIGCSEFSLAAQTLTAHRPLIDTLDILVMEIAAFWQSK